MRVSGPGNKETVPFSISDAGTRLPLPTPLLLRDQHRGVAISRSTSLARSAGDNCKAAASSVSTVSDRS